MAVETPAFVGRQHVVIRPEDEPSHICRSLCFTTCMCRTTTHNVPGIFYTMANPWFMVLVVPT
jgi:hypothetical protein